MSELRGGFLEVNVSSNSRLSTLRCKPSWPCRRMTCEYCLKDRRSHFITNGVAHAESNGLNRHVIVSWPWKDESDSWEVLYSNVPRLIRFMSGRKCGPYIRTIAIGERNCPHIHMLIRESSEQKVQSIVSRNWPGPQTIVHSEDAECIDSLLGYFFDRNFVPSYFKRLRIPGMRLITASRPMKYGFPRNSEINNSKKVLKGLGKNSSGHSLTGMGMKEMNVSASKYENSDCESRN